MQIRPVLLCLALLSTSVAAHAADKNAFLLNRWGKTAATTTYTVDTVKDGVRVRSRVEYTGDGQGNTRAFEYAIGKDGRLNSATRHDTTTWSDTLTIFTPSKANDALTVSDMKGTERTAERTFPLPSPESTLVLPDDPAIWEVLLKVIAAHPHANGIYMLTVPAYDKIPDQVLPFQLSPAAESTGTLDGKPIPLKHYTLTFHDGPKTEIYTDADGRLMCAQVGAPNATHIRKNFTLSGK